MSRAKDLLKMTTVPILVHARIRATKNMLTEHIRYRFYRRLSSAEKAYERIREKYPNAEEYVTDWGIVTARSIVLKDRDEGYTLLIPRVKDTVDNIIRKLACS